MNYLQSKSWWKENDIFLVMPFITPCLFGLCQISIKALCVKVLSLVCEQTWRKSDFYYYSTKANGKGKSDISCQGDVIVLNPTKNYFLLWLGFFSLFAYFLWVLHRSWKQMTDLFNSVSTWTTQNCSFQLSHSKFMLFIFYQCNQ